MSGLSAERIVSLLGGRAVPFSEVSAHRVSLEAAYLELTRDAVEYRAGRPGRRRNDRDHDNAGPAGDPRRARPAPAAASEWIKFRTVRGWVIGLIAGAMVTVAWGLLVANGGSTTCQSSPTGPVLSGAACLPHIPVGPGGEAVTDSFYVAHQPLDGDGSITVRVTSLTGRYSTGGIAPGPRPGGAASPAASSPGPRPGSSSRRPPQPGSAYAAMMVTGGHGVRMQYDYTPTRPACRDVSAGSPRWLRLTRSGDTLTGYDSPDGSRWTEVGTARPGRAARPPWRPGCSPPRPTAPSLCPSRWAAALPPAVPPWQPPPSTMSACPAPGRTAGTAASSATVLADSRRRPAASGTLAEVSP